MAREFKLPDLGEGIHEGEVIAVLVSVEDAVKEGDPILEVETDKASVEIPSPFTGRVADIRVKSGDTVKVGDVMMTFDDGDEAQPIRAKKPESRPPAPSPSDPEAVQDRSGGPVPASPSTRRLARELGVDLYQVSPSGPKGQVTADDVRRFASGHAEPARAPSAAGPDAGADVETDEGRPLPFDTSVTIPDFSKWGPVETLPLRSIRKATARQMTIAWSQIPHVSSQDDIDVTRLEALRRRHKGEVEARAGRLTVTVFAVKAIATVLRALPQFNASLDVEKSRIIRKQYIHVGVAADTGEGLVVPVLRDADRKSITEIAVELNDLITRTRNRKVDLEELQGGSMTLTNIGAAGGRGHFSPIINFPEAAILGISAARVKPVARKKKGGGTEFVPRLMMPVVLTIDHRLLDGVDSTRFLELFRKIMENPEKMLLNI